MKYLLFLNSTIFLAVPAVAQEPGRNEVVVAESVRDDVITVVATGSSIRLNQTGQTISVITRAELDRVQGPDLARSLERLPGVSLARNGPAGATTSLFVRGANSDEVLVLVDGVRVADYASPGGNYDLGALQAGNLGKVELLRGSNSVIWGSQAMGGVLAVTTRDANGLEATIEHGAYNTTYATATSGLQRDAYGVTLNAGYLHSTGFSAKNGSAEADGVNQWEVSGKARARLAPDLTAHLASRYANTRLGVDLAGPDQADTQWGKEGSARAALEYVSSGIILGGGIGFNALARRYDSPLFGPSEYFGRAISADFKGRAELPSHLSLDFGADSEWSRARSTFDKRQSARASSAHALLGWTNSGVAIAVGARIDDHDRFGSHATFGVNATAGIAGNWRVRAAWGQGFKAPTLYQLYGSFVGNSALKPETSDSIEWGIEKGTRASPFHAALTWFRRTSRNLIDLDRNFTYTNIARTRAEGVEVELGARPSEHFSAFANYTWLKARDLVQGRDLARRPRHTVSLGADWTTPLAALSLGADLRFVSKAVDYAFGGTVLPIRDHAVATLRASLPVGERFELYGRVENLTDARYETVAGYNTPGRAAYLGARVRY